MTSGPPPLSSTGTNLLQTVFEGGGDDLLVVTAERGWTREALARASRDEAEALRGAGVEPGRVHPLDARPDIDTLVTLLALWRLGAVPALLHPGLTRPEWTEGIEALSRAGRAGEVPEGTAAVLWTSGTSGHPRGVALGHDGLITSARAAAERLTLGPEDVWLATLSPSHVGGLALLTRSLLLGSTLVLAGPTRAEAVPGFLRGGAAAPAVTHLSLVPTQLRRLLEAWGEGPPPRSFRLALIGGARTPPELVERALFTGWPVALTYGMTEMTSQVATATPAEVLYDPEAVGRPLRGVEIRVDPSGEIRTRGPTRALAYLGSDAPLADAEGWYHTGDLGELDGEGRLRVTGRRSDRIISGGVTVDAHEVEAALRKHPAVADAGVVGIPDPEWGERVVAAVVPASRGGGVDGGTAAAFAADWDAWCRGRLSVAKVPREWRILDALPLNARGKVDRARLRGLFQEGREP
jgi:O-succinylbenzoic acid--CoA ligase